jgi:glycerol-3-phosphate acyltransferase PlsX
MKIWLDPRRYNGAVFLGLNGVVVKSHGGTDAEGFAHAVDVAVDMVTHRFNERLREGLGRLVGVMAQPAPPEKQDLGKQGFAPAVSR